MGTKKHPHTKKHLKTDLPKKAYNPTKASKTVLPQKLEVVLKCDSVGSLEAAAPVVMAAGDPNVEIDIIHSGVGAITQSDLEMAITGSRLVLGFDVNVLTRIAKMSREQGIEVRLYNVIYRLANDLKHITDRLIPLEEKEIIIGEAKVIALFKSSRQGIILGCEVLNGRLAQGNDFRVISAMGPIYKGKIESLQKEKTALKEAKKGQQVGLKITHFKDAKIGDLVESYKMVQPDKKEHWHPNGGVFHIES